MNSFSRIFIAGALAVVSVFSPLSAQPAPAEPTPLQLEINEIRKGVSPKLNANQRGWDAYAENLAQIDRLLQKYAGDAESVAFLMFHRGMILKLGVGDEAEAMRWYERVINEYPDSQAAQGAKRQKALLTPEGKAQFEAQRAEQQAKAKTYEEVRAALIGKAAPPISFLWSSVEGWSSLDDLKGKVVVLDFWATWCGPCIKSFPKIREKVARYADSSVVILGVTSLQGRVSNLESKPIEVKDDPAREYALTAEFMKKHEMTWPVVFSTENVFNPAYAVRGIPNVTIIAPDGTVRATGLHPTVNEQEIASHITALLQEFNLPVPAGRS